MKREGIYIYNRRNWSEKVLETVDIAFKQEEKKKKHIAGHKKDCRQVVSAVAV